MNEQNLQNQINDLQQLIRRVHNPNEKGRISQIPNNYYSLEVDNGNATGTFTIDWGKGNVQYLTLTGDTTLTFIGALSGMRCILQIAGAYTPTFPATVRWSAGSTPAATATAGHKDIYSFVYSGKEGLYDGIQSNNFATT